MDEFKPKHVYFEKRTSPYQCECYGCNKRAAFWIGRTDFKHTCFNICEDEAKALYSQMAEEFGQPLANGDILIDARLQLSEMKEEIKKKDAEIAKMKEENAILVDRVGVDLTSEDDDVEEVDEKLLQLSHDILYVLRTEKFKLTKTALIKILVESGIDFNEEHTITELFDELFPGLSDIEIVEQNEDGEVN